MTTALGTHSRRAVALYLSRPSGGRFDWRLGLGGGLAVGLPLLVGVLIGRADWGVLAGIGGWLVYLAEPVGDTRTRVIASVRRIALTATATGLGAVSAGNLWAGIALVVLFALLAVRPAVGVTPVLCVAIAATAGAAASPAAHTLLFLAGAGWAAGLLLMPFFGGRHTRPDETATPAGETASALPHATRLAVCCALLFAVVDVTALPHGAWALTGVVTTLRPSRSATAERIVKRLGGHLAGVLLAALALSVLGLLAPVYSVVAVAFFGALARPLRRVNYGFWPIFAVPTMLLLAGTGTQLGWIDAVERLGDNALGAALAALAIQARSISWNRRRNACSPDSSTATTIPNSSPNAGTASTCSTVSMPPAPATTPNAAKSWRSCSAPSVPAPGSCPASNATTGI